MTPESTFNEFKTASKTDLFKMLEENNFSDKHLDMKIWNLTRDRIAELLIAINELEERKIQLQKTTNVKIYKKELATL